MANKHFQVDFICIGTQRAGTTWLDKMLRAHPQIGIPDLKEVNFFNDYIHFEDLSERIANYQRGTAWYQSNFPPAGRFEFLGEVTPAYLDRPEVPARIKKHFPQVKLIALLRDPVERTYSNYLFYRDYLLLDDSPSLEDAIREHPGYLRRSSYYQNLKRYYDQFPAEQIKVFLFDDIKEDPAAVIRDVYAFIGARDDFVPPALASRENPASRVRSRLLARLVLTWLPALAGRLKDLRLGFVVETAGKLRVREFLSSAVEKWNRVTCKVPPLNPETERLLYREFEKDIQRLESLLDRDLSGWKRRA